MLKNNNISLIAAGASLTSIGIGTYYMIKQYLNNQKLKEYSNAMDNVLSKSSLMKKKNRSKNAKKNSNNEDKLINQSGFQDADQEVKAILIESRNKKNRKLLDLDHHVMGEIDEEQELKKSLDDFEQVINSKIKISSAQFNGLGKRISSRPMRKQSAKNEFSEMISDDLMYSAGACNSVCLARVDDEAYICFTCMKNNSKTSSNQAIINQNILSTEDDEEGDEEDVEEEDQEESNEDAENYLNSQLDILGVQRGVSQLEIKKEPRKRRSKKRSYHSLNQCQYYCWNCIQEHHSHHQVCEISSQSLYISNNPNLKSSLGSSKSISDHAQIYQPKLNAEQQIYLTAIKEQMEMQQMNSHAVGLYCCSLEQILVTEDNIPVQIENHLSQELNFIFDSLFDRVKQAETEEFNHLLHIILKRIDEIMIDNNILIYIMGKILIQKNIIDRILRYDSIESQNQKKFSEILMKMAKIDNTLRSEIAVILLQDFKYVFVSHVLSSALLFMLKSAEVRKYVTQKLNKTSQFCAGLLNIKSIFEKFPDSHRYRNKLLRCLYITRALCEDRTFVVQGLLNKATKQFAELLCDVARYLDKKSIIHRQNFFKDLIHTGLGDEIFFLKNMDFQFRLLFSDFIQNAHYAPEKYRQLLWQKLSFYLQQNAENFRHEIETNEKVNDKKGNQQKKKNTQENNQYEYIYLNITSLNMVTIMQRDIRCSKFSFNIEDYVQEAHVIIKRYLFAIQEGYQILLLHHYGSVVNNPQNRCLFEHVKCIYGFPDIGDYDLVTYLQQSINDSTFVKELFMKHNFPSFDLYQNLRILFTDYSNQLGQILINIFQINHQELPLSILLKEINRYVHIDNISSLNLNIFCQTIPDEERKKNYQKKFQNEPIYKLKETYYNEFFPLIFCKYPEDYDKLIKQQQLSFKLRKFDNHFTQQIGNQLFSGSSNSSEEILGNAPKVLSVNFFNNKDNTNDIFGSDYNFILIKDRLMNFHTAIMDKILPTTQAFFMIDREDPLLCIIIQLYIRIILFQTESSPSSFTKSTQYPSKNQTNQLQSLIPEKVLQKMKSFKSINKYLIEDIEYMKTHNHGISLHLKRHSSSNQ